MWPTVALISVNYSCFRTFYLIASVIFFGVDPLPKGSSSQLMHNDEKHSRLINIFNFVIILICWSEGRLRGWFREILILYHWELRVGWDGRRSMAMRNIMVKYLSHEKMCLNCFCLDRQAERQTWFIEKLHFRKDHWFELKRPEEISQVKVLNPKK